MKYLSTLNCLAKLPKKIGQYAEKYMNLLDSSLEELERLEEMSSKCETCEEACKLRNEVRIIGENLAKLCAML